MKKKSIRIIVGWVLIIGWMSLIFVMSNEPATISDDKSKFVIYIFNLLGISLNSFFGELANFAVRKAAHFSEYMILFLLSYNVLKNYVTVRDAYILGLLIVAGYSCTDEIHQLFIPGRSGKFQDVLIDTSGGIFGMVILCVKNLITRSMQKNLSLRAEKRLFQDKK